MRFSPDHSLSSDSNDEIGSNNEGDPKDPEYILSESPMDSDEEEERLPSESDGPNMEQGGERTTPPPHCYPTRQRGFKRSLMELLNEPDYYVSPYTYPRSPQKKAPWNNQ